MKQQLAIGISIIDFLCANRPKEGYSKNKTQENARILYDIIEDNFIVMDNQYAKHINAEIESITREKYGNAADDLKISMLLLFDNKKYKLDIDLDEYDLFRLANSTDDKIAFDTGWNNKNVRRNEKRNPQIEFHTIQSFIEPEVYHRLKNVPCEYKMEKGVSYDIKIILNPFIRYAKYIHIIDQYMMNENARVNLQKILECINSNTSVKLSPLSEPLYIRKANDQKKKEEYRENYKKFKQLLKEFNGKIIIDEFRATKHIDRYIITDQVDISIPSLDFLNDNGEAKVEDAYKDIQKIRINWKKTKDG
jgi:hypothetical protein